MARPRRKAEADVEEDHQQAHTRQTTPEDPEHAGGAARAGDAPPDRNSTTGTTPNATFVGRVSGDDAGVAEETGAERRARDQRRSS